MSETEQALSQPSNTGLRLIACGIRLCASLPLIWPLVRWLVAFLVSPDKVAPAKDTVDLVGTIGVAFCPASA